LSATGRDIERPWMTLLTSIRERFIESASAEGVVPFMRIEALICSGCICVISWFQSETFQVEMYCDFILKFVNNFF
jgi:hypothetical protein